MAKRRSWFRSQLPSVLEYKEDAKDILVWRYPMEGREIMKGTRITVRESQKAIFVHKGQIADVFGPGDYKLETENIPFLTQLASWKYAFETPIKADLYFINTRQFTDEKWGTINPIIVRDQDFGMVRIRGFGKYSFRVTDPTVFLHELFGTSSGYSRDDISNYLSTMLLSALTDTIGESNIPILDLAANTMELNEEIEKVIREKFVELGLELVNFFIENLSLPKDVEEALDERSKMGIIGDKMNTYMQYQAANAMRDAANNEGSGLAGAGVGLGAGMGMGQMFNGIFQNSMNQNSQQSSKISCPHCGSENRNGAKFCNSCGKKLIIEKKNCPKCGNAVNSSAKFCPNCGYNFAEANKQIICQECGTKNPDGTKFCMNCGNKLSD